MDNINLHKTHPLIVGAAIAVILTCLVALGVMTGIVPSPMNRGDDKQEFATGAAPSSTTTTLRESSPSGTTTTTRESRTVTRAPANEPRRLTDNTPARPAPARPAPATGATSSSTSESVSGTSVARSAPAAPAACANCGTVSSVRAVTKQGDASMIGPAAGALAGGVLGRQIGDGSGQTIATVVGAGVGAAAGTEIERRYKKTTEYVVAVQMNDGSSRSFNYPSAPGVSSGERVRVVDGRLIRD